MIWPVDKRALAPITKKFRCTRANCRAARRNSARKAKLIWRELERRLASKVHSQIVVVLPESAA